MAEETEKPTVSLSEEESKLFQRILRSSRKDVESVEIDEKDGVRIKLPFLSEIHMDYQEALDMDDAAWDQFFVKHKPLI